MTYDSTDYDPVVEYGNQMTDPALDWRVWLSMCPWASLVEYWFDSDRRSFARCLGVSQRTVRRWLNGECKPCVATRHKVTRVWFRECMETDCRKWDLWLAQKDRMTRDRESERRL